MFPNPIRCEQLYGEYICGTYQKKHELANSSKVTSRFIKCVQRVSDPTKRYGLEQVFKHELRRYINTGEEFALNVLFGNLRRTVAKNVLEEPRHDYSSIFGKLRENGTYHGKEDGFRQVRSTILNNGYDWPRYYQYMLINLFAMQLAGEVVLSLTDSFSTSTVKFPLPVAPPVPESQVVKPIEVLALDSQSEALQRAVEEFAKYAKHEGVPPLPVTQAEVDLWYDDQLHEETQTFERVCEQLQNERDSKIEVIREQYAPLFARAKSALDAKTRQLEILKEKDTALVASAQVAARALELLAAIKRGVPSE